MSNFSFSTRDTTDLVDVRNERPPNPWRDAVPVPVVGPLGQISTTFFDKRLMQRGHPISMGDTPASYSLEQGIGVNRAYRQAGWVLYEDLCSGDVKGCDASPKHWQLWTKVAQAFAEDRGFHRGVIEKIAKRLELDGIYHPEVARRRSLADQGGSQAMSEDAFMAYMFPDAPPPGDDFDLDALAEEPIKPRKGDRK